MAIVLTPAGLMTADNATAATPPTSTADIALAAYPPKFKVRCATEGPAKSYPSANKTMRRDCWWGYEILFSKNDTKIIAGITGGVLSVAAERRVSKELAQQLLLRGSQGGGAAAVNNAIDGGKCLKLTVIYPMGPGPGTYHCM